VPGERCKTAGRAGRPASRRDLLRGGAGMAFASVFASGSHATGDDLGQVMLRLSEYMSEAGGRALPWAVAREATHHILDTLAAMISGSRLPPGQRALRLARSFVGGPRTSTIAASRLACGPIEAGIVNGAMAHADETDDNASTGGAHPGCAVVPAALALGEMAGVDGTRFLRAVTLGYDVGMRALKAILATTVLRDTHNVVGTFGASAAAASILGLDAQRMRWLLDYASQQAGAGYGVWQRDRQHMEKSFVFGSMGARNGMTAALMVQSGFDGVDDVLTGRDSFFATYAPNADPNDLIDGLGERYEVTRTIIKKWSTGGPVQSPLDAVLNLRRRHPFSPDQVEQIVVRLSTSAAPKVDNVASPDLCLQYLVAAMLLDGTLTFRAAHDSARMQSPDILRQRNKVQVVADEELEHLLPRRVAVVEILLKDGSRLSERNDTVRGTPENPMSRDEIVQKARDLMVPVLGAAKTTRLIETVLELERVRSIRTLRPLLQTG
jgi:2-methylcitrate dehydratase PrpD